jgi:hypothetical protein
MRQAIAAFQHGDTDALREKYFAEGIRWHFPAGARWPVITRAWPRYSGRSADSSSSPVAPTVSR